MLLGVAFGSLLVSADPVGRMFTPRRPCAHPWDPPPGATRPTSSVEVQRLEPAGGERPAPLEKRVWIDALEEAHGEWMREKARGRAERSVGLLLTTGGSRRCLRGRLLPARARREAAEALNIKHTETNRTPHTPEM